MKTETEPNRLAVAGIGDPGRNGSALTLDTLPQLESVETALIKSGTDPEDIEPVLWLIDWAQSREIRNLSALSREVNLDAAIISRVFRGNYQGSIANIAGRIRHFRQLWTERQDWAEEIFVPELSIVQRLSKFAELVRATGQIGIVFGPNQSGKTTALEHLARTGAMIAYAKLPAGGGLKLSVHAIAKARGGISTRKDPIELRDMLLRRFNRQWLLVIDEFHQTMVGRKLMTLTIERIREFYDISKTPLLLCGTDLVPEMFEDPRLKYFLGQIANRGVLKMRIPPAPTSRDIRLLIKAYGFDSSSSSSSIPLDTKKRIDQIAQTYGIGRLTKYFQIARRLAAKKKERITWDHFARTYDTLSSWSRGQFGDEQYEKRQPQNHHKIRRHRPGESEEISRAQRGEPESTRIDC
jgi:hypothetical protein